MSLNPFTTYTTTRLSCQAVVSHTNRIDFTDSSASRVCAFLASVQSLLYLIFRVGFDDEKTTLANDKVGHESNCSWCYYTRVLKNEEILDVLQRREYLHVRIAKWQASSSLVTARYGCFTSCLVWWVAYVVKSSDTPHDL